ncbi:HAD family hydrolase [Brevundimonas sp. 2R-24]|uniref:HAD family hydrolase n=1 Tax=Peiella sedimenti TaxID=3061083 RepID=A0ABT8SRH3_9CAUL|nr:HAD family hydrolase [Caulobacteraceae bacterium XZ-24]
MSATLITTLGLDADDTLWHNETLFRLTHQRFCELLSDRADPEDLEARLSATEARNLRLYGYGIKGFTLSMIETAMELCDGEAPPRVIAEILAAGREMLSQPVEPLPGVTETLTELAADYRLVLVTKGDLMDQERKLAASGLGELFAAVEIVSEKTAATYRAVFSRHGTGPAHACMVGNSMRSDVLPALEAGSWAIHIPYEITWAHELADPPQDHPRYATLERISQVPDWLKAAAMIG